MLADHEPWRSTGDGSYEQVGQEPTASMVESTVPEAIEVNFELDPETESVLKKLGAVSIKPIAYPSAA